MTTTFTKEQKIIIELRLIHESGVAENTLALMDDEIDEPDEFYQGLIKGAECMIQDAETLFGLKWDGAKHVQK